MGGVCVGVCEEQRQRAEQVSTKQDLAISDSIKQNRSQKNSYSPLQSNNKTHIFDKLLYI